MLSNITYNLWRVLSIFYFWPSLKEQAGTNLILKSTFKVKNQLKLTTLNNNFRLKLNTLKI